MENKKRTKGPLTEQEIELVEQLRRQPKILERMQRIMEIARSAEGPLKTADEVEELLIEEMRKLGNATMHQWAEQAQERLSQELQQEDATVLKRKKKG